MVDRLHDDFAEEALASTREGFSWLQACRLLRQRLALEALTGTVMTHRRQRRRTAVATRASHHRIDPMDKQRRTMGAAGAPMRWVSVLTLGLISGMPCLAEPLTAHGLEARIRSEAASCPPEGLKLKIERLAIVGAAQHNKVRRDMGAKVDGRPGQRYAVVYARSGKQVAPVASLGPLEGSVQPDDLRGLQGTEYCDKDDG